MGLQYHRDRLTILCFSMLTRYQTVTDISTTTKSALATCNASLSDQPSYRINLTKLSNDTQRRAVSATLTFSACIYTMGVCIAKCIGLCCCTLLCVVCLVLKFLLFIDLLYRPKAAAGYSRRAGTVLGHRRCGSVRIYVVLSVRRNHFVAGTLPQVAYSPIYFR